MTGLVFLEKVLRLAVLLVSLQKRQEGLAIVACATKMRTSGSRPNEIATVRHLRRAVAIERRWEGDLTGHHFWASSQRGGCTIIHCRI